MIEPNDPNWDRLQATSKAAKDNPAAWLAMEDIYGEVGKSKVFAEAFARQPENAMGNRHAADADALPLRHALTGERRRKELDGSRSESSGSPARPIAAVTAA